ncbi:unnamed protein product [Pieris macdunnoughi]|uniref:Uncharacterized protein n=1 Tax=Pieris macdunnoughi TaxID=345717 RepID=A0A821RGB3_9NEOP|nr:unnamed protein product [Pieris macdunnoughi]
METALLFTLLALHQVAGDCKNCVKLDKEQEAMFRAHSDACLAEVGEGRADLIVDLKGMKGGPAARSYIYCVLQRCKMVGKDGKMLKAAVISKLMLGRNSAKKVTKELESCVEKTDGDRPEDHAWTLFRCSWNQKGIPGDFMPHLIPADV